MTRPAGGYVLDGKRVPGVTTIISRFKESGALIHWAWTLGLDGKDYREVRDSAANVGTIAHSMIESWIKLRDFDASSYDPEQVKKASVSFEAFRAWAGGMQFRMVESEVSMLSKSHRFGGTTDVVLTNGQLAVADWKTANAIYSDSLYQIAAYKALWDENHPDQPITGGLHLFRFAKDDGSFHHGWWPELDEAWRGFLLMRELYDIDARLKRRSN